jgi:hypothetical protein
LGDRKGLHLGGSPQALASLFSTRPFVKSTFRLKPPGGFGKLWDCRSVHKVTDPRSFALSPAPGHSRPDRFDGEDMPMVKKKNEEPQAEWDTIEIGDQVKHVKWGTGTVLFRSGMGDSAKAIVVFPEEGQKKLMLKYAKLKKVGSTSLKSVEKLKAESGIATPRKPVKAAVIDDLPEAEEEVALDLGDEPEVALEDDADEVLAFDDEEEDEFGGPEAGAEE